MIHLLKNKINKIYDMHQIIQISWKTILEDKL